MNKTDKNEKDWKIKKEVGNRIQESRKTAGFTQSQVAEILLITQQQYSRFENGVFELNYSQLIAICKLFDISADFLLGLDPYDQGIPKN